MVNSASAFVRCPACRHRVYHGMRRCPHCGRRMRWNTKALVAWALAAAMAILLGLGLADLATVDDRPPPTPSFGNP